jgi:hypothetical protein
MRPDLHLHMNTTQIRFLRKPKLSTKTQISYTYFTKIGYFPPLRRYSWRFVVSTNLSIGKTLLDIVSSNSTVISGTSASHVFIVTLI